MRRGQVICDIGLLCAAYDYIDFKHNQDVRQQGRGEVMMMRNSSGESADQKKRNDDAQRRPARTVTMGRLRSERFLRFRQFLCRDESVNLGEGMKRACRPQGFLTC